jgi:hypothetical protein
MSVDSHRWYSKIIGFIASLATIVALVVAVNSYTDAKNSSKNKENSELRIQLLAIQTKNNSLEKDLLLSRKNRNDFIRNIELNEI